MRDSMGVGRFTDSPVNGGNAKKRSRQLYTPQQTQKLEAMFHKNNFPDRDTIDNLCQLLEISDTRLVNWFKNRRARSRREPKDGSPNMDLDTDLDGTVEDVTPPGSPKYKPPDAIIKPKIHTGSYSIQRLMEKDPVTPMEVPDHHPQIDQRQQPRDPPQQIMMPNLLPMTDMSRRSARPNRRFPNPSPFSHQPIRHLHHMTSLLPHTPERSLTSSLSHVLMSQMDHHITPDMHARSIRHLESLQCRPFENGGMRNGNGHVNQDMNYYETGNPLWDLYYTYRDEIVPVREYYDAVPGVTRNVIKVEEEKTLLVL